MLCRAVLFSEAILTALPGLAWPRPYTQSLRPVCGHHGEATQSTPSLLLLLLLLLQLYCCCPCENQCLVY